MQSFITRANFSKSFSQKTKHYLPGLFKRYDLYLTGVTLKHSGLSSLPQLLCLILVARQLDHYGRKPILLVSIAGMALGMLALTLFGMLDDSTRRWAVFVGVLYIRVIFALGLGSVPPVYSAEILPSTIRAKGMGLVSLLNWVANAIVALSFLELKQRLKVTVDLGQKGTISLNFVYTLYASLLALSFLVVSLYYRETRQQSLELVPTEISESEDEDRSASRTRLL